MLSELKKELESLADEEQAKNLQRFFKTGFGEYGEGDVFLGIKVPVQRKVAKKYDLDLAELQDLLNSKFHEFRFTALVVLMNKYAKADEKLKKEIFNFYLGNVKGINNWDLVDVSAPRIVGDYLFHNPSGKKIPYKLAKSKNLWEKRIAIVSTFAFIRENNLDDTLALAEILLGDGHDLIHKAVGWALREVGKKDKKILENFLEKNYSQMSRMTLRYAIERFPEKERKEWLSKTY